MVSPESSQPHHSNPLLERQQLISGMFEYIATHDSLTGLLNKAAWKSNIEERIEEDQPFGVMFMDMNSFKRINDVLGHDRGDAVLKDFAEFLGSRFHRSSDALSHEKLISPDDAESSNTETTLSRWAGDEFGITFSLSDNSRRGTDPATGKLLSVSERVEQEADYLKASIDEFVAAQPDDIKELGFDVSIGTAPWDPENPSTADELFKKVDEEMFKNKDLKKQEAARRMPLHKRVMRKAGHFLLKHAGDPTRS